VSGAARADQWRACLVAHGCRLTAARDAVVAIVAASEYVLAPLEVYEQARQRVPQIGLVTVYRTLEKLEELGLIQRVHQPSGCQAFAAAPGGHTHLLICQQCGRVSYFAGDRLDHLIDQVGQESRFTIQEHWLQLFGDCPDCKPDAV
jgi:Fe2+ or Zn2+ uptake regulation protein